MLIYPLPSLEGQPGIENRIGTNQTKTKKARKKTQRVKQRKAVKTADVGGC